MFKIRNILKNIWIFVAEAQTIRAQRELKLWQHIGRWS